MFSQAHVDAEEGTTDELKVHFSEHSAQDLQEYVAGQRETCTGPGLTCRESVVSSHHHEEQTLIRRFMKHSFDQIAGGPSGHLWHTQPTGEQPASVAGSLKTQHL